jgi:hypothetical protein
MRFFGIEAQLKTFKILTLNLAFNNNFYEIFFKSDLHLIKNIMN